MSVSTRIVRTWRSPRGVMRDHLAMGVREDRALIFLMTGCLLAFVAQLPFFSRTAALGGESFEQQATYGLFGWVMIAPILMYGIAALGWLVARPFLPGLTGYGARLALFWAFLAAAPVLLLRGMTLAFVGAGTEAMLVGAVWALAFTVFWVQGLREAGQAPRATVA